MVKRLAFLPIFLLLFTGISSAQQISPTLTPTPSAVKYDLPYPGMLPDHPLYKLKVLRDKVVLLFIQDPIKKAEYHLLLADKRIHMAKLLIDKGDIELAKETALKGENEITNLVNLLKDKREKPTNDLFNRVEKASIKHQKVLDGIAKKVGEKDRDTFDTVIYFSNVNLEELRKVYKTY